MLCRAVGTDALEGVILNWNISASNTSSSILVTNEDFEKTGLIQRSGHSFKLVLLKLNYVCSSLNLL